MCFHIKVCCSQLILTNIGIYLGRLIEPTNIKLHWFLSCYICAQMGRQTGRGVEGGDKNV